MSSRLASPSGTGESEQPCSNCGGPVRYWERYAAWLHSDGTRVCPPKVA